MGEAEAVSLKSVTVAHAPIAQVHLRALWEGVLLRGDDEVVVFRHILQKRVPNTEGLLLGELLLGRFLFFILLFILDSILEFFSHLDSL